MTASRRFASVAQEEVFFERVEEVAPPPRATRETRSARDAYFSVPRFPLAGPIIERSTGRQLKGVCGKCQARLRLSVKGPGIVRVICPICGHAKRLRF
jgi:hypothetical protein